MAVTSTVEQPARPGGAGRRSERPVRVLVVMPRYLPVYSGAAQQQHDVLKNLGRGAVEGTVVTLRLPGLPRRDSLDGVRILRLGAGGADRLSRLLYAIQVFSHLVVRGAEYDVVHSIGPGWACFLTPLAARVRGIPTVFTSTLMGSDDPLSIRAQSLGRLKVGLLRLYRSVTAYTSNQVAIFSEAGFSGNALHELTCGVDDEYFRPGPDPECRRELRRIAGREDEGPVLLFVGTLVPRKGVDLLIEAFRRLLGRHPSAVLVLVGPRNREEEFDIDEAFVQGLEERCRAPDLRNHVAFLGRVSSPERKRSILRASDLLALFSESEGLGIVVLEAMACGIPPVLTPLPGVFDYMVADGRDGRIASSRDPSVLCEALHDVLAAEDRRQALGRAARGTITRRFSLSLIASRYLDLYRRYPPRGRP